MANDTVWDIQGRDPSGLGFPITYDGHLAGTGAWPGANTIVYQRIREGSGAISRIGMHVGVPDSATPGTTDQCWAAVYSPAAGFTGRLAKPGTRKALSFSFTMTGTNVFNQIPVGPTVFTDGAMGSGSTTLTSASATFTANDVGKPISVNGAGAAGVVLNTTISGFTDAHTVTLAAANASGGAISGKSFVYSQTQVNIGDWFAVGLPTTVTTIGGVGSIQAGFHSGLSGSEVLNPPIPPTSPAPTAGTTGRAPCLVGI